MNDLRYVAAGLAASLILATCGSPGPRIHVPEPAYWPTFEWRRATPETQGVDSAQLALTLKTIHERQIPIHSLQIIRNGYVVLDAYFYPYDGRTLHDTASVTKSVTATLVGVALNQGLIASMKTPLLSFFANGSIANRDQRKDAITLSDVLTMRPGLACDEVGERTLGEMRRHANWTQFMLDQPMSASPGKHFVYCSPGMHVMSTVLTDVAHASALEFARRVLFAPLGIQQVAWPSDPNGNSFGWGDLHLHPLDMAKIGFLYLHDGRWEGRQILSAAWVQDATSVHASPWFRNAYGYGWWVFTGKRAGQYEAVGRGGQRITVIPADNLIVVMTGGGFEPGDIGDSLLKAIGPNRSLPENPLAVGQLKDAVRAATLRPPAHSTSSIPAVATRIDGVSYRFAPNDLGLQTASLQFISPTEAALDATFSDGRAVHDKIGLDGVPRLSAGGRVDLPVALSAEWTSNDTFSLMYDELANINAFQMRWHFSDPQHITVDVRERSDGSTFVLTARQGKATSLEGVKLGE